MDVTCKKCRRPIVAEDVSNDGAIARCRACGIVFAAGGPLTLGGDPSQPRTRAPTTGGSRGNGDKSRQPDLPAPRGFRVERDGPSLRIGYRWLDRWPILTAIFVGSYVIMMFTIPDLHKVWNSVFSAETPIERTGALMIAALFLGTAYVIAAQLINRTTIDVGPGKLEILHGPLPWPGTTLSFSAADPDQFFCEKRVGTGRSGGGITYDVSVVLKNGRRRRLITGYRDAAEAIFVEQTIERHLGIRDWPVPGAFKG